MIAWVLNRRRVCKVKLKDADTAKRMEISIAELASFQDQLNEGGLMTCRRAITQTTYQFTAAISEKEPISK
jgi:hypothetical protein